MDKLLENTIIQIKKTAKYKSINIKELASSIRMSESGLHAAFRKETITYLSVIKICRRLKVDIIDIISAAKNYSPMEANEPVESYDTVNEEIKLLNEKLAFREEQVEYYKWLAEKYKNGANINSNKNQVQ